MKCHALNLQLRAKLSFLLSSHAISVTWIKNNLDTLVTERVRKWLDLPPCSTAHYIPLPSKHLGLDVVLPSLLFEQCQASSTAILAKSKDEKMKTLYQLNKNDFKVQIDPNLSKTEILKQVKNKQLTNQKIKLDSLHILTWRYTYLESPQVRSRTPNRWQQKQGLSVSF